MNIERIKMIIERVHRRGGTRDLIKWRVKSDTLQVIIIPERSCLQNYSISWFLHSIHGWMHCQTRIIRFVWHSPTNKMHKISFWYVHINIGRLRRWWLPIWVTYYGIKILFMWKSYLAWFDCNLSNENDTNTHNNVAACCIHCPLIPIRVWPNIPTTLSSPTDRTDTELLH